MTFEVDSEIIQHTSRFGRARTPAQRRVAQWIWFVIDLVLIVIAAFATAWLIDRELGTTQWLVIALIAAAYCLVCQQRGLYRSVLIYSGIDELVSIGLAMISGIIAAVVTTYFLQLINTGGLGRVFLVMFAFAVVTSCGGARLIARRFLETRLPTSDRRRALVYGAGALGEAVVRELRRNPGYLTVGMLDDDPARHGISIRGQRVYGGIAQLRELIPRLQPDVLVIANRTLDQEGLRTVFQTSMDLGLQVKVVHGIGINTNQKVQLQDLALEDLLRRPQRNLDREPVSALLKRKVVLVTGAGGSIGSELCRQVAMAGAHELVLIDHSEFNLYQIDNDLRHRFPEVLVTPVLATLADLRTLENIINRHCPEVVFHAAAYKHVPMVEENPFLGMTNNLGGYANLLHACIRHKVPQVVTISTDKAVRPTNVMGASKRACEVLMQSIESGDTRLCAVRFGNVLGSSGSVIPRFLEQIHHGGPVTVTHPDVTRYFMLLPEAVELVLQAGAIAKHGEILILDMGEPVRIVNLARQLIYMTGHLPDQDIRIIFSGLRPGEKLTEELLLDGSENATVVDGITVARSTRRDHQEVGELVAKLLTACQERDLAAFIHLTLKLVPEWQPSREFSALMEGRTDSFPALSG
jgi:FlaA1/EpsC-like NDP-sugar epimerase